jgi:hypothetical protein
LATAKKKPRVHRVPRALKEQVGRRVRQAELRFRRGEIK